MHSNSITVVKRDGSYDNLDLAKIRKAINWGLTGLDLNPLELESALNLVFRDGISTEEIQQNLIHTALNLIGSPSDSNFLDNTQWAVAAARYYLMDMYKKACQNRDVSHFGYGQDFYQYLRKSINLGVYTDKSLITSYTKEEIRHLGFHIDQKYDMLLDYTAAYSAMTKECRTYEGKPWELIQERLMVGAMQQFKDWDKKSRISMVLKYYTN